MKYRRFATSSCKDLGIRNFELVAKTQFLCFSFWFHPAEWEGEGEGAPLNEITIFSELVASSFGFDFSYNIEEKLNYPVIDTNFNGSPIRWVLTEKL